MRTTKRSLVLGSSGFSVECSERSKRNSSEQIALLNANLSVTKIKSENAKAMRTRIIQDSENELRI